MGRCTREGQIGKPFTEQKMDCSVRTKTSASDYETLCDTDVLGLKKSHYKHDYKSQYKTQ